MLIRTYRFLPSMVITALLGLFATNIGFAKQISEHTEPSRQIDVVIALDVSGSMSGLIGSAKQRLWDIVNQLGRARPQPELRIAIMSYGNPEYGQNMGYVRIDLPFTSDLDAVNRTLFGFTTNGGDEYVARAVSTSTPSELPRPRSPTARRSRPAREDGLESEAHARGAADRQLRSTRRT